MEDKITADLDVSIVGQFNPSPYSTGVLYCEKVKPADLAGFESSIMPTDAKLAGLSDPNSAWRANAALRARPKLLEKLQAEYPKAGNAKRPKKKKKPPKEKKAKDKDEKSDK